MMYRPDTITDSAIRMLRERVSDDLAARIREDLKHYDWTNGTLHGLHETFDLLRQDRWPKTAQERDELCRTWECSPRALYGWRKDVLYCVFAAVMETALQTALPT